MSEQRVIPAVSEGQVYGRLVMLSGDQQGREYVLDQYVTTVGRALNNDIVIADPQTSRRHLEIVREQNSFAAVDAASANGFYVNDLLIKRASLRNGDIITIGRIRMAFMVVPADYDRNKPTSALSSPFDKATISGSGSIDPAWLLASDASTVSFDSLNPKTAPFESLDLKIRPVTSVGRDPVLSNLALDNPQVSRRHFQIKAETERFLVNDLRSTNGTYVNGQRLGEAPLQLNDGDLLSAGPFRFMFSRGFLYRAQDADSVRVDVLNISKKVKKGQTLLQNISFTILPREFVAIVGTSGAGKSTLLDAISGVRPATSGAVLYNQSDYYSQMEAFTSAIGYVPQEDIVPSGLTVYKALYYAARLRLPPDTTPTEIAARLEEVMEDLGLSANREAPIHTLSGGERKRVSIGAELISKPSLFFLDEPTSGLDPGLEGRMMQLLRKLADQGRTVVLITHATQNVELCDQVLFMGRGGYAAFYGTPVQALSYFGVSRFSDIYIKLETEKSPAEWAGMFKASSYYNNNVAARLRAVSQQAALYGIGLKEEVPLLNPLPSSVPQVPFRRPAAGISGWSQFRLLTARYWETLISDRKYMAILLLQAPIIALMMAVVFSRDDFSPASGDFGKAKTLVFLMVVVAVWFGTSNSAREIVKETSIYRRERRIGLKMVPYIGSKLALQFALVVFQILALLAILWAGLGLGTSSAESLVYIFLTLVLTAVAGITLGLLISSLTSNSDRATSFVPIALIPQIIFGGAIVPLSKTGPVGNFISQFIITKWGFRAAGTLVNLDGLPSPRLRFYGPPPEQAAEIERFFRGSIHYEAPDWFLTPSRELEFNTAVTSQWTILGLIILVTLGLIFFFQARKDQNYTY